MVLITIWMERIKKENKQQTMYGLMDLCGELWERMQMEVFV